MTYYDRRTGAHKKVFSFIRVFLVLITYYALIIVGDVLLIISLLSHDPAGVLEILILDLWFALLGLPIAVLYFLLRYVLLSKTCVAKPGFKCIYCKSAWCVTRQPTAKKLSYAKTSS